MKEKCCACTFIFAKNKMPTWSIWHILNCFPHRQMWILPSPAPRRLVCFFAVRSGFPVSRYRRVPSVAGSCVFDTDFQTKDQCIYTLAPKGASCHCDGLQSLRPLSSISMRSQTSHYRTKQSHIKHHQSFIPVTNLI